MIVTYRVFLEENGQYTVRELFLEQDGKVITYGREPVIPRGGSLHELTQEINWLQEALALPVLTVAEVEEEIAEQAAPSKRARKTVSHADLMAKLGLDSDNEGDVIKPALSSQANRSAGG